MVNDRELVEQAWARAGGKCECKRIGCQHPGGRCGNTLNQKAFHLDDEDGWYVRLINEFGPQKMFNIEVACSKCFNKLKSAQEAKSKPISDERRKSLEF